MNQMFSSATMPPSSTALLFSSILSFPFISFLPFPFPSLLLLKTLCPFIYVPPCFPSPHLILFMLIIVDMQKYKLIFTATSSYLQLALTFVRVSAYAVIMHCLFGPSCVLPFNSSTPVWWLR